MRMFIGIPLQEAARTKLSRTVDGLSLPENDFRRSHPQDWHITLQFLGNVTPGQLECLLPSLSAISAPPVPVRITEIGFLGDRVLGAHVQPTLELQNLSEKVIAATRPCGFQPENRPWRPHITVVRTTNPANSTSIARVRGQIDKTSAQAMECGFLASEFLLYESFTEAERARYEVRGRFPLRGTRIKMAAIE